jgi:hypothetical protein
MMQFVSRTSAAALLCCAAVACSDTPVSPDIAPSASWSTVPAPEPGASHPAVIFVVTQGLFFSTCSVKQLLPMHGEFQLLIDGRTNFGPGQPAFLGGRWWEDLNRNGIQDQGDHFFFCPLVLPGRLIP